MKLYVGMLAAAAMALVGPALVGTSHAADGDQFIIRGDATKTILEQNETVSYTHLTLPTILRV